MQFLFMIHANESGWSAMTPEQQAAGTQAYMKFAQDITEKKHLLGSNRLTPAKGAKLVRVQDGKNVVTDGPYAESKEQVGGYFLIQAKDLNEAVAIAAQCPGASHGVVEVRQVWEMGAASGA